MLSLVEYPFEQCFLIYPRLSPDQPAYILHCSGSRIQDTSFRPSSVRQRSLWKTGVALTKRDLHCPSRKSTRRKKLSRPIMPLRENRWSRSSYRFAQPSSLHVRPAFHHRSPLHRSYPFPAFPFYMKNCRYRIFISNLLFSFFLWLLTESVAAVIAYQQHPDWCLCGARSSWTRVQNRRSPGEQAPHLKV